MQKKNVCDFGDILSFAKTVGFPDWNKTHDLLDSYYPSYGPMDVNKEEVEEEEENEDVKKILLGFMEHHNVTEFQINPKSC